MHNKRISIVVVLEHPDKAGEYISAQPYEVFSTFRCEDKKVRARITQQGSLFYLKIKVDKTQHKPVVISSSRLIYCLGDAAVLFENNYYVLINNIQI